MNGSSLLILSLLYLELKVTIRIKSQFLMMQSTKNLRMVKLFMETTSITS